MVEPADIDPGARAVTSFAAQQSSIGAFLRHALFEFTLMWIGVACRAGAVGKMEWRNLVRSSSEAHFVAFRTRDGHMRAGQRKMRILMLGNGERGAVKIFNSMAILASVLVGRGGKLLVMGILVAILARPKLHLVDRVFAGGHVTFVATDGNMFSFKRVTGCRVFFRAK